jgi:hypothetical protein
MFRDRQTNVLDEEQSGRPSAVSNDLVQSAEQQICERQHLTMSELCVTFYKFYALFCKRLSQLGWTVTSFVHGCAQNAENGFGFCGIF